MSAHAALEAEAAAAEKEAAIRALRVELLQAQLSQLEAEHRAAQLRAEAKAAVVSNSLPSHPTFDHYTQGSINCQQLHRGPGPIDPRIKLRDPVAASALAVARQHHGLKRPEDGLQTVAAFGDGRVGTGAAALMATGVPAGRSDAADPQDARTVSQSDPGRNSRRESRSRGLSPRRRSDHSRIQSQQRGRERDRSLSRACSHRPSRSPLPKRHRTSHGDSNDARHRSLGDSRSCDRPRGEARKVMRQHEGRKSRSPHANAASVGSLPGIRSQPSLASSIPAVATPMLLVPTKATLSLSPTSPAQLDGPFHPAPPTDGHSASGHTSGPNSYCQPSEHQPQAELLPHAEQLHPGPRVQQQPLQAPSPLCPAMLLLPSTSAPQNAQPPSQSPSPPPLPSVALSLPPPPPPGSPPRGAQEQSIVWQAQQELQKMQQDVLHRCQQNLGHSQLSQSAQLSPLMNGQHQQHLHQRSSFPTAALHVAEPNAGTDAEAAAMPCHGDERTSQARAQMQNGKQLKWKQMMQLQKQQPKQPPHASAAPPSRAPNSPEDRKPTQASLPVGLTAGNLASVPPDPPAPGHVTTVPPLAPPPPAEVAQAPAPGDSRPYQEQPQHTSVPVGEQVRPATHEAASQPRLQSQSQASHQDQPCKARSAPLQARRPRRPPVAGTVVRKCEPKSPAQDACPAAGTHATVSARTQLDAAVAQPRKPSLSVGTVTTQAQQLQHAHVPAGAFRVGLDGCGRVTAGAQRLRALLNNDMRQPRELTLVAHPGKARYKVKFERYIIDRGEFSALKKALHVRRTDSVELWTQHPLEQDVIHIRRVEGPWEGPPHQQRHQQQQQIQPQSNGGGMPLRLQAGLPAAGDVCPLTSKPGPKRLKPSFLETGVKRPERSLKMLTKVAKSTNPVGISTAAAAAAVADAATAAGVGARRGSSRWRMLYSDQEWAELQASGAVTAVGPMTPKPLHALPATRRPHNPNKLPAGVSSRLVGPVGVKHVVTAGAHLKGRLYLPSAPTFMLLQGTRRPPEMNFIAEGGPTGAELGRATIAFRETSGNPNSGHPGLESHGFAADGSSSRAGWLHLLALLKVDSSKDATIGFYKDESRADTIRMCKVSA